MRETTLSLRRRRTSDRGWTRSILLSSYRFRLHPHHHRRRFLYLRTRHPNPAVVTHRTHQSRGWEGWRGNRCRRRGREAAAADSAWYARRWCAAHRSRGDAHAPPTNSADRHHHRRRATTTATTTTPRPYVGATPDVRSTSVFCIVVPAKPNTTTVARRRSRVRSLFFSFPFTSFSLVVLSPTSSAVPCVTLSTPLTFPTTVSVHPRALTLVISPHLSLLILSASVLHLPVSESTRKETSRSRGSGNRQTIQGRYAISSLGVLLQSRTSTAAAVAAEAVATTTPTTLDNAGKRVRRYGGGILWWQLWWRRFRWPGLWVV